MHAVSSKALFELNKSAALMADIQNKQVDPFTCKRLRIIFAIKRLTIISVASVLTLVLYIHCFLHEGSAFFFRENLSQVKVAIP